MPHVLSLLLLVWWSGPIWADDTPIMSVIAIPFNDAAALLGDRITFDDHPKVKEPGHLIEGLFWTPGARVGEHFAGQDVISLRTKDRGQFDTLSCSPAAPLTVRLGGAGETLALAYHRGFGSMAAFALGPLGYQDIAARGEGAVAVLFAQNQPAAGLRIHADYVDPLGSRPNTLFVYFTFYARDGAILCRIDQQLEHGIVSFGWRFPQSPVAGFTMTTVNPGGVAIDDILVSQTRVGS